MFPESRFRHYAGYKMYRRYTFQFILIELVKGDENVRPCDRHSNETMTLRKLTKYINMRKWMVKFLRKFENYDIKIDRVHTILIKSINLQLLTLILNGVEGPL